MPTLPIKASFAAREVTVGMVGRVSWPATAILSKEEETVVVPLFWIRKLRRVELCGWDAWEGSQYLWLRIGIYFDSRKKSDQNVKAQIKLRSIHGRPDIISSEHRLKEGLLQEGEDRQAKGKPRS